MILEASLLFCFFSVWIGHDPVCFVRLALYKDLWKILWNKGILEIDVNVIVIQLIVCYKQITIITVKLYSLNNHSAIRYSRIPGISNKRWHQTCRRFPKSKGISFTKGSAPCSCDEFTNRLCDDFGFFLLWWPMGLGMDRKPVNIYNN